MNATSVDASEELSALEKLARTLLLVIAFQVLGYTFKRSGVMPADRAPGLGFFVANVALPSLLFRSIATLDLSAVDVALVAAVISAKLLVFVGAALLGLGVTKRSEPPGSALCNCGLFALCCTASDDIAG